jgi:CheY-like chemotaxis protein
VNRARPCSLVAGTPEALQTLTSLLSEDLDLLLARSVTEALGLVDSGIDLIICNVQFDESRMFDFLHELQKHPRHVPVICCRTRPDPIRRGSKRAIELALEALGVGIFVDLAQLRADYGEDADRMFRAMVLMQAGVTRPASGPAF